MSTSSLWVYIWRFQPFHNGHEKIVSQMLKDNIQNMIIIGSTENQDERNIFSAAWRRESIKKAFPDIDIELLRDTPDDTKWILSLKKLLEKSNSKTYKFYCGDKKNDYAIQVIEQHKGLFENVHIEIVEISRKILPISATQIREELEKWWIDNIEELVPEEVYSHIKKREA